MENLVIRTWPKIKAVSFRLSPAAWLTIAYILLSASWIIGSDRLAADISGQDRLLFERLQGVKGLFFVFLSSIVLFFLSRRFYNNLRASFLQKEEIQEKFDAVNELTREGFFDCDLSSGKAEMNNRMKFFLPAHDNEVDDFWKKYQQRIHPDDINRLKHEYERIISSGKTKWLLEYQLLGRDNKYHTVISSIYVIRDEETGKATRLVGALHDITELRNLQAENYEQRLIHRQRLTQSIIKAQENERERWSGELHDNVCQVLGVAKLYLSEIASDKQSSSNLVKETDKIVTQALNEIRQLSSTIKPPLFSKMTLPESIESLVANVKRVKRFDFSLDTNQFDEELVSEDHKLLIYRVIQEQLNNIVKYAEAGKVDVRICLVKENKVEMVIKDNGKGFDPQKIKAGIGLRNIESRVQANKGLLEIQSSPGTGCTLSASFLL